MQHKKRKIGKKNKRNKRGGTSENEERISITEDLIPDLTNVTFKNYGPGSGHNDPFSNTNNTKKLLAKFLIGGAITAIGIWLLLKFKK